MLLKRSSIDDIAALKEPKSLYNTLLSHCPEYKISITGLLEVVYFAIKYGHCDLLVLLERKEKKLLKDEGWYDNICSVIKMVQTKDEVNCAIISNKIAKLHYLELNVHDFRISGREKLMDKYLKRFGITDYWQENLLPDMCSRGHYTYVRHIFEKHPQMVRLTNAEGISILDLAVKKNKDVVKYLLEQKLPVTHMTFLYACGMGYKPKFEIDSISKELPEILGLLLNAVDSDDNIQRDGCDFSSHNCFNSSNANVGCGIARLSPNNRYPINILCQLLEIKSPVYCIYCVINCISKLVESSISIEFLFTYSFCLNSMVSSLIHKINRLHLIVAFLEAVMPKSNKGWCTLLKDADSVQLIERYICPQDERNELRYNCVLRRKFRYIPLLQNELRCLSTIDCLLDINTGNQDTVWDDLYTIISELLKLGAKPETNVIQEQIPRLVNRKALKLARLLFNCLSIPNQFVLIKVMITARRSPVEDEWLDDLLRSSLSLKYQAMHAICENLKRSPIYSIGKLELPTVLKADIVFNIY